MRKVMLVCLALVSGATLALADAAEDCALNNDIDTRLKGCSEVIDRDPGAAWAYGSRAAGYIRKGEYERAILDLTIAIDIGAPSAINYNNRAWAYFKGGKAAEGLPDVERSLQLRPDHPNALDTRGNIFAVLGRRDEAIADFRKVLALHPNDVNAQEARKALERLGASP
jgi:tetratricopeptide (TPR) repeat protein